MILVDGFGVFTREKSTGGLKLTVDATVVEPAGSDFTAVGLNRVFTGFAGFQHGSRPGLKLPELPSSSVEGEDGCDSEVVRLGFELSLRGGGPFKRTVLDPTQQLGISV